MEEAGTVNSQKLGEPLRGAGTQPVGKRHRLANEEGVEWGSGGSLSQEEGSVWLGPKLQKRGACWLVLRL